MRREIGELAHERLYLLFKSRQIALDLRAQAELFMPRFENCAFSSFKPTAGSLKRRSSAAPTPVFDREPSIRIA